MGRETVGVLHFNGTASEGKALLETDEIVFRGERRIRIPFRSIHSVKAVDGSLTVSATSGEYIFDLGEAAYAWEKTLLNPKSLVDKLGIKDSHSVLLVEVTDNDLIAMIRNRAGSVTAVQGGAFDVVMLQIHSPAELARISELKSAIHDDGMIWAITPKKTPGLIDVDVIETAKAAGLVDIKVARISDTLTAWKLVVPKALRAKK
jgi:hypothetical protein